MDIGTLYRGIESARGLDGPSTGMRRKILAITERSDGSRTVAALLRGAAVGHPIHPALVAIPVGAWTASLMFDTVLRDPRTARRLIGLGLVSTPPVLLTGWLDWSERGDVATFGPVQPARQQNRWRRDQPEPDQSSCGPRVAEHGVEHQRSRPGAYRNRYEGGMDGMPDSSAPEKRCDST